MKESCGKGAGRVSAPSNPEGARDLLLLLDRAAQLNAESAERYIERLDSGTDLSGYIYVDVLNPDLTDAKRKTTDYDGRRRFTSR